MSDDDEDFVDDIEDEEESDESDESVIKIQAGNIDARRRLEAKLEEIRLRKMTDDYDF